MGKLLPSPMRGASVLWAHTGPLGPLGPLGPEGLLSTGWALEGLALPSWPSWPGRAREQLK